MTPDFLALAYKHGCQERHVWRGDADEESAKQVAAFGKAQYLAGLARAEVLAEEHIDSSSRARYVYALRAEAAKIAGTA